MIVAVVVNVEDPVQLRVLVNVQLAVALAAFAQRLSGILLHLDVVEFPEKKNRNENVNQKKK